MSKLRKRILSLLLICLSTTLLFCGCTAAPPDPDVLLSFLTEPFLCGFTVGDTTAALSRTEDGDILTVNGTHGNTVFRFSDGAVFLCTGSSETEPALEIPVQLPEDNGAALWHRVFCIPSGPGFRAERMDDSILVTDEAQTFSAVFDTAGIPKTLTYMGTTLYITSFTTQNSSVSE